jgi:hypothetical protein
LIHPGAVNPRPTTEGGEMLDKILNGAVGGALMGLCGVLILPAVMKKFGGGGPKNM